MITPHPYQIVGRDFALATKRGYIAADPGAGKTGIACMIIGALRKPALVVAPLTPAYSTWPEEVNKWLPGWTVGVMHGRNREKVLNSQCDVRVINYESLEWLYDSLAAMPKNRPAPFEVLIIDEGSMLRDPSSKRYRYLDALMGLFPEYRVVLSGTPAPKTLIGLWAQYRLLTGKRALPMSFTAYRNEFFRPDDYNEYNWTIKSPEHEAEIHKLVRPWTFRVDMSDHLALPPLQAVKWPIILTASLRAQYHKLKKEFSLEVGGVKHIARSAAARSGKLRQFLQGFLYQEEDARKQKKATEIHTLKLDALWELRSQTQEPLLVAVQFSHEIEMIRRTWPNAAVIAGETSVKQTAEYIKAWNAGRLHMLICHPASLSHGVNLQFGGRIVVWYCLPWSLDQYIQFYRRLWRQGQQWPVYMYILSAENTIDDHVAEVLMEHNATQERLLTALKG